MGVANLIGRKSAAAILTVTSLVLLAGTAYAEPGISSAKSLRFPMGSDVTQGVEFAGLSCQSPGNCVDVGYSTSKGETGNSIPFAGSESSGSWSTPVPISYGTGASGSDGLLGVSCWATGSCLAVGDSSNDVPMTAVETGGTWSPATSLQDLPANATLGEYEVAQLDSAWCSSIGNCVVAGTYNPMDGEPVAYTASEVDGVWQTAKEVPMPAGAFSVGFVLGFSCASTSSCILLDSFESNSTRTWGVYTSTLADGSWSTPQVYIPAILKINTWLGGTCYAIELCIAGGFGKDNLTSGGAPVVAVFDTGTWKGATFLPLPRLSPVEAGGEIFDISCPSATECVAVGDLNPEFSSSAGRIPAVYTWSHGTWSSANVLHVVLAPSTKPWDSILTSVACPSTSNCTALGLAILRDTDSSPWDPYAVAIAPVETIGSPGAPTEVTGNSSGSKLTVTWEPPLSDGGSSIASFRIKVIGPGTHAAGCTTVSRSCSFSGVVKDKTYSIEASDLSRAGKRSAESSARLLVH